MVIYIYIYTHKNRGHVTEKDYLMGGFGLYSRFGIATGDGNHPGVVGFCALPYVPWRLNGWNPKVMERNGWFRWLFPDFNEGWCWKVSSFFALHFCRGVKEKGKVKPEVLMLQNSRRWWPATSMTMPGVPSRDEKILDASKDWFLFRCLRRTLPSTMWSL